MYIRLIKGEKKVREINVELIKNNIKDMFINANYFLTCDVMDKLCSCRNNEVSDIGRDILDQIIDNANLAAKQNVAICQDTGMSVVFIEIGQDVHLVGGNLETAINTGVEQAYKEGYLRKSVVADPLRRVNTGNNTPAIIHYEIVAGEKVRLKIMPKGFGSENMSALKMLKPSDGIEGVIDFVVSTVEKAGSNPCPPIVVGVGIGGTMEKAALLSKKALFRPMNEYNKDEFYADLEKQLLNKINNLGIGPQGLGGITTALGVKIETYPTHIAGLPVAVNITCHVSRHLEVEI